MRITKSDKDKLVNAMRNALDKRTTRVITKAERRGAGQYIEVEKDYISISKYLTGTMLGDWSGAETELRLYKALGADSGSAGGFLLPEVLAADVIERLKDKSVIRGMPGVRVVKIPGYKKSWAAVTDAPTISWGSENTAITEDTSMAFGLKTLQTHKATCLYKASRELFGAGAGPSADAIVRQELADALAAEEDAVFLQGTGGTKPLGIYYNTRVVSTDLSGTVGFDDLMEAEFNVRALNSRITGWVCHPRSTYDLRKLKDSQGRYLLQEPGTDRIGRMDVGSLWGRPLRDTTEISIDNMPSSDESYIVGGDWADLMIGELGELRIETSVHGDAFAADQVHVKLVRFVGSLLRHPESFVVIKGIQTA